MNTADINMHQENLFDSPSPDSATRIEIPGLKNGPALVYYRDLFDPRLANDYLSTLETELNWQQPNIRIAGRSIPIPRKQCWQGDAPHQYTYSGQPFIAEPWHPKVLEILHLVQALSGSRFNSVLCNLYRDGRDSVAWHSDNEPELGAAPAIASVSLGAERLFHIKVNDGISPSLKLPLAHNSLLFMPAGIQHHCVHQLPKTKKCQQTRINLTFREVITPAES